MSQSVPHPRNRIQEIHNLPPLAPVAQSLLTELGRKEIEIDRLALIIEQDPALTARLIGVANSAYFSQREPIYDITTAIVRVLGLNLVKSLTLGIILSAPLDTRNCPAFRLEQYWCKAMLTATLVKQLAAHTELEAGSDEYLFLGGLLHNLGELALVHVFPVAMNTVLTQSAEPQDLETLQREHIGLSAAEAGMVLGRKWHLPTRVVDIIAHHPDPSYREKEWRGIILVGYCSRLVNANFCSPDPLPQEAPLIAADILEIPAATIIAALLQLQDKYQQTLELAKALAHGGPPRG